MKKTKYKNIKEFIDKAMEVSDKLPNEKKRHIDVVIAASKRPDLMYHWMKKNDNCNRKLLRDAIVRSKNPLYNYYVARDFKNYRVTNYTEINNSGLLVSNLNYYTDNEYAMGNHYSDEFFLDVADQTELGYFEESVTYEMSDYDLSENEKIVLDSKNPQLCCLFAMNIPGANVEALGEVVMNSDDEEAKALFIDKVINDERDRFYHKSKEDIIKTRTLKRCIH